MKQAHVFMIILLLIVVYIATWFFTPKTELGMLIVNKTVADTEYREHRAIHWFLKHWRFSDLQGNFLHHARDYLGYHPDSDRRELLDDKDLEGKTLLYLADAYGIYDYEKGLVDYEKRLPYELQEIDLIFGGMTSSEIAVVNRFASQSGNYLVGEHNVFGYPTYLDNAASRELQNIFGVQYQGWLVRYYESLDEMAFWVKLLYEKIYGKSFALTGPGLVVVREDSSRAGWYGDLVIIEQQDLTLQYPVIHGSEHPLLHGAARRVPYLYWMEFLYVQPDSHVLAYYELPVNAEAEKRLRNRGLPTKIPAVVLTGKPGEAKRIYFAGDFADQLPPFLPSWLTGSAILQRLLTYVPGVPPHYQFAFRWYKPILSNILKAASRR